MRPYQVIMDQLIEDTRTLLSAIQAETLEEVVDLIEQREELISELETFRGQKLSSEELERLEVFKQVESDVEEVFGLWMTKESESNKLVRVEKMQLNQNKKVINQYNQSSAYNAQGFTLDQKK